MSWEGRGSRQSRGYGALWDALRKAVLTAEPLCRVCRLGGRVSTAKSVDHIKSKAKGGTDALSNLQPLCDECRRSKDAADRGQRVRHGCTADGRPLSPSHHWNRK